jgi:poly(beta-D-mannuronate) lyase
MHLVVGEPIVSIMNNDLYKSGSLEISGDQKYEVKNLWNLDPKFKDILDFTLKNDSPLRNKGIDGTNLGVVKWKE